MMNKCKRFGSLLVALTLVLGICLGQTQVSAAASTGGSIVYQAENYYSGTISEGIAADMQPNEKIEIALNTNSSFADGQYLLTVNSCGNRESFDILVNGESVGTIRRSGTGYGQDQMTGDKLYTVLTLKSTDVVTIVAPDGSYWGWVDSMQLDSICGSLAVYEVENFYDGNKSGDGIAADMQPNEKIEIALNSYTGFAEGKYELTIRSCGNRTSYEILVNGESVGTLTRSGTDFGINHLTANKLSVELNLKPDDVITIVAPADGYGWVDYLLLTGAHSFTDKASSSQATAATAAEAATYYVQCDNCDKIHDTLTVAVGEPDSSQTPADPDDGQEGTEDKTETEAPGEEIGYDYIIYQCEKYYDKISENVAADLQPGEQIDIPLNSDNSFVGGSYKLTIYSCGNRESFDILVNGEKVGTVTRTGTGFGQDQMTYDKLSVVLELTPEDTLTLVGPTGEYWGWVDFIVLDVVREAPETGDSANVLIPVIMAMSVSALAVLAVNKRRFWA